MIYYLSSLLPVGHVSILSIFLNNSTSAFRQLYFNGMFFGITSIMELVGIGLIIGFHSIKYPFTIFYVFPHGIFENLSYIIAGAA